jgi:CheY-like chemotaxis protein
MPIMNGIDALEKLQALYPSIPVVMMTAFPSPEIILECEQKGAKEVITKPIRNSTLNMSLQRALQP